MIKKEFNSLIYYFVMLALFIFTGCSNDITNIVLNNPQYRINEKYIATNSIDTAYQYNLTFDESVKIGYGCSDAKFFSGDYTIDTSQQPHRIIIKIKNSNDKAEIGNILSGLIKTEGRILQMILNNSENTAVPLSFDDSLQFQYFKSYQNNSLAAVPQQPQPVSPGWPITISMGPTEYQAGVNPTFTWVAVSNADSYSIQIAEDPTFDTIIFSDCGIIKTSIRYRFPLRYYTKYYWRVSATNSQGTSLWSTVYHLRTRPDF